MFSFLYDAILVDEYQDTDVMQQDLLDLIRRPDTWFTVMGDDDQSIYTWRGANPDMIRNLAAREGLEAMRLSTNFRCTKETVEAAECFVEGSPGRVEKELKVVPGATGEIPELRAADGEDKELDEIAAIIKESGKDGYGKNKIAFLARTNSMVAAVKARLKKEGIPVAEPPDRRAIIGKVSTVLSWIEGRSSSAAIMGMAGETCMESLSRMAKAGISGVREEDAWLRENAEGIAADIAQLERPADLSEAIVMAVRIGCFEEHEKASLRKIYAEIKKTPAADISDKLNDMLLEAADPREEMSEGVVVTTIHQSKGRQFGRVVLDATSGIFPRAGTGKTEEEKRLAYVAFTRAMESLKIVFNARRGLSSLLRDLMDPEKVKGLKSYSKYQKQEKGKKNGMHGIVGFPEAWALSAPAVAGREKETAATRNDVIAAAESDLKRKIGSGLPVPGRTRTEE